jgi:formamidopyrimidine-DNA glycosylase
MPELPEVQTIVNDLIKEHIIGKTIIDTSFFWPKSIAEIPPSQFSEQLLQQQILHIERIGKYICMQVGNLYLFIHLRMSGRLYLKNEESPLFPYERVRLHLDDGRIIAFIDQRKFGRIYLLSSPSKILQNLGVDPTKADFTISHFTPLLRRKMKIKSLLLNQKIISGIGNIYADEVLWAAKIHPESMAKDLTPEQIKALYEAILKILFSAIERQGTSLGENASNFHNLKGKTGTYVHQLQVYHKTNLSCFWCQTKITKIKLQGRSSHLCEKCQIK